jgi:hypothetical protein
LNLQDKWETLTDVISAIFSLYQQINGATINQMIPVDAVIVFYIINGYNYIVLGFTRELTGDERTLIETTMKGTLEDKDTNFAILKY